MTKTYLISAQPNFSDSWGEESGPRPQPCLQIRNDLESRWSRIAKVIWGSSYLEMGALYYYGGGSSNIGSQSLYDRRSIVLTSNQKTGEEPELNSSRCTGHKERTHRIHPRIAPPLFCAKHQTPVSASLCGISDYSNEYHPEKDQMGPLLVVEVRSRFDDCGNRHYSAYTPPGRSPNSTTQGPIPRPA